MDNTQELQSSLLSSSFPSLCIPCRRNYCRRGVVAPTKPSHRRCHVSHTPQLSSPRLAVIGWTFSSLCRLRIPSKSLVEWSIVSHRLAMGAVATTELSRVTNNLSVRSIAVSQWRRRREATMAAGEVERKKRGKDELGFCFKMRIMNRWGTHLKTLKRPLYTLN